MVHRHSLARDRRGAAILEFALVLPFLSALLFGILAYGQYFLLAHSVQELANDAARATIGGVTAAERVQLARDTVGAELPQIAAMPAERVTTQVAEANGFVTVEVRFDATAITLFHTPLVPMPSPMIARRAVIRASTMA